MNATNLASPQLATGIGVLCTFWALTPARGQVPRSDSAAVLTALAAHLQRTETTRDDRLAVMAGGHTSTPRSSPDPLAAMFSAVLPGVSVVPAPIGAPVGSEARRQQSVRASAEYDVVWTIGSVSLGTTDGTAEVFTTRNHRPKYATFSTATRIFNLRRVAGEWRVVSEQLVSIEDGTYRGDSAFGTPGVPNVEKRPPEGGG